MNIAVLFPVVGSMIIAGILAKSVSPSIVQQVKATKVDTQVIQTEKAIFEAISRYITLKNTNPTSMTDLINEGYFQASSNNNGFGGTYSFTIDSTKGTVTISTDIADLAARTAFINSYKNTFKPIQGSGNTVNTTFVLPTSVMHGNGQLRDDIPIQSTAPNVSTNKYWYDSSGAEVVLKMSDGVAWKSVSSGSSGGGSSSTPTTLTLEDTSALAYNSSLTNSDIKYVYDSEANQIIQYVYYNGSWYNMNTSSSIYKVPHPVIFAGYSSNYYLNSKKELFAWGSNSYGVLGNGTTGGSSNSPLKVSDSLKFSSLSTNSFSASMYASVCGITTSNDAYCWGSNDSGKLGLGVSDTSINNETLVVGGNKWINISTGASHSCGITTSNDAYCWGSQSSGRLGNGQTSSSVNIPVAVSGGLKFKQVTTGINFSCGITTSNDAYCWGSNVFGNLGDGTGNDSSVPVAVSGGLKFIKISSGESHTCGLTDSGTVNNDGKAIGDVYCWGSGEYSQIGQSGNSNIPYFKSSNIVEISSGAYHTCVINNIGILSCWGRNLEGQLGRNTAEYASPDELLIVTPAPLESSFDNVSSGFKHTCAVTKNKETYCWGEGDTLNNLLGDINFKNTIAYRYGTDDVYLESFVETNGQIYSYNLNMSFDTNNFVQAGEQWYSNNDGVNLFIQGVTIPIKTNLINVE